VAVSNGQYANQDTFNNAFMSRTKDTSTTGKIALLNADSPTIPDAQAKINELSSDLGTVQTAISTLGGRVTNVENQLAELADETTEYSFTIENDQDDPADVTDLVFDKDQFKAAIVDYLIQRITDEEELVEVGYMLAFYLSESETWVLTQGPTGGDAGVTFTITAAGQVQYVSTSISGNEIVSKLSYRVRKLVG